MLYNLEVLNGEISPNFSSEVFNYVVNVNKDILTLVFNYDTCDNCTVTVYGNNNLTPGENHVLIEVYDDKVTTYTLVVNKEYTSETPVFKDVNSAKEIKDVSDKSYITPLIGTLCFFTILALFCIIFHKKKNE